jgi:hypothetical protein
MSTDGGDVHLSTGEWWSEQRGPYNFAFLIAGVIAFAACELLACTVIARVDPYIEITIFSLIVQTFLFSVVMGVGLGFANLFYFLGPLSERLVRPQNPQHFRTIVYGIGYWFSVALPFAAPALLLYLGLFHPDQFQHDETLP